MISVNLPVERIIKFLGVFIYLYNYINYTDLYDVNLNFRNPTLYSIFDIQIYFTFNIQKIFFRVMYSSIKNIST